MRIIEKSVAIDKQTIKDLELEKINNKFNDSKTTYGEKWFRDRLFSKPEDLNSTRQIMRHTRDILKLDTTPYQNMLRKIGKQRRGDIYRDLLTQSHLPKVLTNIIPIWVILFPILILCSAIFFRDLLFWVIVSGIVLNFFLYYFTNRQITFFTGSLSYLIDTIKEVERFRGEDLISSLLPPVKKIKRLIRYKIYISNGISSGHMGLDMLSSLHTSLIDYLRIFFCMELYSFIKTRKVIEKHRGLVEEFIYAVGYIDGLLNIKDINETYNTTVVQFDDLNRVVFRELSHPLLENPIPQSFRLDKNIVVTGMNMAGKSTFLKSIAINQILSTAFGFCFAKSFTTNNFSVMTSMKIEDDITRDMSRYYVEAERLLEIQERIKDEPTLCFIDEILSGTNSRDRIDASSKILMNFAHNKHSIILSSTHDDELAHRIEDFYDCYYFDGVVESNKIIYDYQVKDGIVTSSNAINILKNIGISI